MCSCDDLAQGCLQPVGDAVVERLYDLGAVAMAFASFEVCLCA